MMLDFALHLSPDGIALDQRISDGWLRLGDVAFDSDTLASDLAAERARESNHACLARVSA